MSDSDFVATLTLFFYTILLFPLSSVAAADTSVCQYGTSDGNKLYRYSLASPIHRFPHGVLSEDGFYKVVANDTILWFQLCDGMIFNHDPPKCVDCWDCGGASRCGASRCGMGCSALVANYVGGYHVCRTIGDGSRFDIDLADEKSPHMGVIIKMTSIRTPHNCSLSVSVLCNQDGIRGPESMLRSGACDYETVLWHPTGCATVLPLRGKGWGWFGIFLTIVLCSLGFYLLAGGIYRFFFLRIRGLDVIPNLEFWTSIPHRTQSLFRSLILKFRRPTFRERSSYSQANF